MTFKSLQTVFLGFFGASSLGGHPWQILGDIVVSVFEGDIRDSELLRTACKGASEVYHTASLIDVIEKVDYSKIPGANVKGMVDMASFIYTSSIEVAGPNANGDPIINGDENTPYTCSIKFPLLPPAPALRDPQGRGPIRGNFYYISDDTPPISYFDFNRVVLSPLGFRYPPINQQLLNMLNMPFSFTYRSSQRDMGYVPLYSWEEVRKWSMDWLASQLPKERK
uniref:3-beta hydroxysteroid dehydrogenase/isomerase domain-containing protein n=1 Tax=Oncorhynchus kisutch TaxID=8019 RepID=A0A8C7GK20_ONCKI